MRVPKARDVLLRQPSACPPSSLELDRFFRALRLSNGTYKTTCSGRLEDLNDTLIRLVPRGNSIRVLDVAVSSGVTTIDLLDHLASESIACELIATDVMTRAYLSRLGPLEVLFDQNGYPLQLSAGSFVRCRPHDPSRSVRRRVLEGAFQMLQRSRDRGGPQNGIPVLLLTPELEGRQNVTVVEHDLTLYEPRWQDSFDLIRAANILNMDYFDRATLASMASRLCSYLKLGGILAICRTNEQGVNHASVFRRCSSGLDVAARLGMGSEIEEMVLRSCTDGPS